MHSTGNVQQTRWSSVTADGERLLGCREDVIDVDSDPLGCVASGSPAGQWSSTCWTNAVLSRRRTRSASGLSRKLAENAAMT
jgi:hypothetical protein